MSVADKIRQAKRRRDPSYGVGSESRRKALRSGGSSSSSSSRSSSSGSKPNVLVTTRGGGGRTLDISQEDAQTIAEAQRSSGGGVSIRETTGGFEVTTRSRTEGFSSGGFSAEGGFTPAPKAQLEANTTMGSFARDQPDFFYQYDIKREPEQLFTRAPQSFRVTEPTLRERFSMGVEQFKARAIGGLSASAGSATLLKPEVTGLKRVSEIRETPASRIATVTRIGALSGVGSLLGKGASFLGASAIQGASALGTPAVLGTRAIGSITQGALIGLGTGSTIKAFRETPEQERGTFIRQTVLDVGAFGAGFGSTFKPQFQQTGSTPLQQVGRPQIRVSQAKTGETLSTVTSTASGTRTFRVGFGEVTSPVTLKTVTTARTGIGGTGTGTTSNVLTTTLPIGAKPGQTATFTRTLKPTTSIITPSGSGFTIRTDTRRGATVQDVLTTEQFTAGGRTLSQTFTRTSNIPRAKSFRSQDITSFSNIDKTILQVQPSSLASRVSKGSLTKVSRSGVKVTGSVKPSSLESPLFAQAVPLPVGIPRNVGVPASIPFSPKSNAFKGLIPTPGFGVRPTIRPLGNVRLPNLLVFGGRVSGGQLTRQGSLQGSTVLQGAVSSPTSGSLFTPTSAPTSQFIPRASSTSPSSSDFVTSSDTVSSFDIGLRTPTPSRTSPTSVVRGNASSVPSVPGFPASLPRFNLGGGLSGGSRKSSPVGGGAKKYSASLLGAFSGKTETRKKTKGFKGLEIRGL